MVEPVGPLKVPAWAQKGPATVDLRTPEGLVKASEYLQRNKDNPSAIQKFVDAMVRAGENGSFIMNLPK